MAYTRLSMRKIEEVLRLHHECGRSNRAIAEAVRASPTTVGDDLRRARLAGLVWPLVAGMTEAALEAALFPPLPASKVRRPEAQLGGGPSPGGPFWGRPGPALAGVPGVSP